jgi:ribosome recycling factor
LKDELAVRTGRAQPGLVENIIAEVYGSRIPDSTCDYFHAGHRTIAIDPWDKSLMKDISDSSFPARIDAEF